ncbi:chemotaxis protein CheA [Tepidanaerobacter acetatoxydans]|uniref:chemotaxis protein CheA n=1 Tax=Tepidanaerobacter acetatoxydans TaxID=499229 RepID=UPI001BD3956C|nr:chemotaxis protein CheA [Tepidanaerobacter acetatoxydans]
MNNQYLDVFLEEAREHIDNLNTYLLELENSASQEVIDEIFRSAHTLKGMSGTMGYSQLSELTHEMENLLQEIRSHQISVNPQIIDTLLQCVDILEELINDVEEQGNEKQRDIQKVISRLKERNSFLLSNAETITENKKKDEIFSFNEYENRLVIQALEKGLYVWKVVVKLVDECLLKSARAFLVFKTLEAFGEIIKTEPIVQDIEDEKFDNEFTIYLVTSQNKDEISKSLSNVSELESVCVQPVERDSILIQQTNQNNYQIDVDKSEKLTSATKDIPTRTVNTFKKTGKTLRVDIERLDILMNLVSELIIIKTRLDDINGDKDYQAKQREAIEYLERITSNLHDAVMKARMVPIENVFNRFPRVVHDLSRELSKEMDLLIEGAETELDRTIIDEIGDPLIHLIRNAADHGIESPQERVSKGKPERGTIRLKAYHDGNNVVIEVSDDGKGIDLNSVLKKAIEKGLIDNEQSKNLKEYEITSFLFEPGFSTKSSVTDVSGRGVGLDVVKTKIESLGGSIEINNKKDMGTTFLIRLPLTLAIIQALMVMVGEEKYAIPLSSIKETVIIPEKEIKKVQKSEVTVLRGDVIPVIRLNEILDIEKKDEGNDELTLVVVKKGEKDVGLVVDELIGQQEIVIKTLGSFLKDIKFIAGATILGDGEVALILDINKLV